MKFLFSVALAIAVATVSSALPAQNKTSKAAAGQSLVCYDGKDCTGKSATFVQNVYDLAGSGLDNKISCCVFNGIWILYEDANHNADRGPQAGIVYSWGDNKMGRMPVEFDNKASSLRFVGDVNNYRSDSLNLYAREHFTGSEQFAYKDQPKLQLQNFGRSAMVTGCTPWTLYSQVNYGGSSVCLLPGDVIDCLPGVYADFAGFENLMDKVSSVRRGCFSPTKMTAVASRELVYTV